MSTTEPRTIVRHDFPSAEWDPFLTSLFGAILASWKGKRPLTIAAFVPLALCALASFMGLGHLLSEDRIKAAVGRACPPGPKPKDDPQTSLLDVVTWPEDGRPGVFVSLVRLKLGNVRETCGQFVLNLHGCHVPATATAAAVAAGWGVLPEVHGNSDGLRFLPPSVVALYLAGDPAALARQADATANPHAEAVDHYRDALAWILRGAKDSRGYRDPRKIAADCMGVNVEDFAEHGLDPIDAEPFVQRNAIPHGPLSAEDSVLIYEARERMAKQRVLPLGDMDARDGFGPMATPPRDPIADLTIGDFVKLTSGPHAGRIAGICEVSGDKPKASIVGRAVVVKDAVEITHDAVDLTGEDPDNAPKPAANKSKANTKRKGGKP